MYFTNYLSDFTVGGPSRTADNCSPYQDISLMLWNPLVRHGNPPPTTYLVLSLHRRPHPKGHYNC
jgi:hypothetical protein